MGMHLGVWYCKQHINHNLFWLSGDLDDAERSQVHITGALFSGLIYIFNPDTYARHGLTIDLACLWLEMC